MENITTENKYKLVKVSNSGFSNGFLEGLKAEITWMQRRVQYYSFLQNYRVSLHCLRGEIYEFDFGMNINAEFSNRHYGIVLADSLENNPLVIVCPLKTNKRGPNEKSDIDLGIIKELNAVNPTLAVFNQIRAIDKTRIYHKRIIGFNNSNDDEETKLEIPRVSYKIVDAILDAYCEILYK